VYRTLPQTIRFVPGKKYEILFSYQCAYDDEYAFVVGEDTANGEEILKTFPLPKTEKTRYFSTMVKPINQNLWFGVQRLRKNQKGRKEIDLVIDNVGVRRVDK
jgi:endo-alpha-N-acetylgalactosaminidase